MIEIELKDLQVGKTYYIHQVKDEETHAQISRKYKAVCAMDFSMPGGWYDFGFDSVKGINTEDIASGLLGVSIDEQSWGLYKFYLCQREEIIERVIDRVIVNTTLREIIGDPKFTFY
jgi:hypothetical protein